MINIVIPAKNPSYAKQRLGDLLTADQRRDLAVAMFDHVIEQVNASAVPHHALVVTDSADVESRARAAGVAVLREESARGETEAVEEATRWSIRNGYDRQVVIPADLPFLLAADIDEILSAQIPSPGVVICPASGDDGSNAVLTSPPDALTFRFGKRSFPDYVAQAERRNIPCRILRLPRLVLDLDSFEDVKKFLDEATDGPILRLLELWNLRERVN